MGDLGSNGSNPGLGSSPGEGNGNPLQYTCLENSMDRGAWQATVQWCCKSRTGLSTIFLYINEMVCNILIPFLVSSVPLLCSFCPKVNI